MNIAPRLNGLCPKKFGALRRRVLIVTDSSFSGFGAVFGRSWLAGIWSTNHTELRDKFRANCLTPPHVHESLQSNINYLELIAAAFPLLVWAPLFRGCDVCAETDNASTVSFFNRATTKNLEALKWLKILFYTSCKIRLLHTRAPYPRHAERSRRCTQSIH